jgi:hypothetical protein
MSVADHPTRIIQPARIFTSSFKARGAWGLLGYTAFAAIAVAAALIYFMPGGLEITQDPSELVAP